jgi:ATP-dependent DNA helicase RecQ
VLKGELRVEMRHAAPARTRKGKTRRAWDAPQSGVDNGLLARLKAWRSEQARVQAVPAYVIFHDSTLAAIAAAPPRDLDELSGIAGIGAKKLERYGAALLEAVRG